MYSKIRYRWFTEQVTLLYLFCRKPLLRCQVRTTTQWVHCVGVTLGEVEKRGAEPYWRNHISSDHGWGCQLVWLFHGFPFLKGHSHTSLSRGFFQPLVVSFTSDNLTDKGSQEVGEAYIGQIQPLGVIRSSHTTWKSPGHKSNTHLDLLAFPFLGCVLRW